MPVHMANSAIDEVGPYRRMSASQANTYKACPRLWFYQKVYRFKMPQIPVLFVGRAVEEAVCRVLKESPSFIVAASSPDVLSTSPYADDGTPAPAGKADWPAVGLMPLFPHEQPSSKDDLQAWAMERANAHLPLPSNACACSGKRMNERPATGRRSTLTSAWPWFTMPCASISMKLNAAWRQEAVPGWKHGAVANVQLGLHLMAFHTKPSTVIHLPPLALFRGVKLGNSRDRGLSTPTLLRLR